MRTDLLTWITTLALISVTACGCLSADQVDLVIVSTEPIAGAPPPAELRVQVFEAETGQSVVSQTISGADVGIAGLGALGEGQTYVLVVEAGFPAGTCTDDRAVGVSEPFVHRSGAYEIPIQVGCADEFGRTVSQPITPRLAAGLETATDGTAVLAGGAPQIEFGDEVQISEVVGTIERYAPTTGEFVASGTMLTGRAFPALQAIPQGGVAVFGGFLPGIPACEATVELIVGSASTAKGSLTQGRCRPGAALLSVAERLVVGGDGDIETRAFDFEAFDPEAEFQIESAIAGHAFRELPRLVPFGNGVTMLAVGGASPARGGPIVEAVHYGAGCPSDETPCTFPVPAPGIDLRGLVDTAAVYAECPSGPGTIYIVGGRAGTTDGNRALNQILCVREEENVADLRVVRAGTLPEPRTRHEMAYVRGERLLVVGGGQTASIIDDLLEDALLVPIDPCSCEEVSPQVLKRIPLPFTGSALLHQLTPLPDGSVLLVGGARIFPTDAVRANYEALGEAALFVPGLP